MLAIFSEVGFTDVVIEDTSQYSFDGKKIIKFKKELFAMHIPDGYLSPQTDAVLGLVSALGLSVGARKASQSVRAKDVPLLAIGAAFSFTIMMFNVPVPDGTTAHAVGGSLLAILLGPWAAMLSISIALIIQAVFFGDGGILALGANIFNMGIVLPFISYFVYKLVATKSPAGSKRRWIAAAIAGYIGITAAAVMAGIEFGLQPLLFHSVTGVPLYCPYGLSQAVPAMLFAHLTVAGPIEGVVTVLVLRYLQQSNPAFLEDDQSARDKAPLSWKRFLPWLAVLVVLSPLGLLASGTAWGEWGGEDLQSQLGFVPQGLGKLGEFWKHVLLPDYGIAGFDQSFWQQALGYLLSALLGLILIALIAWPLQRIWRKKKG